MFIKILAHNKKKRDRKQHSRIMYVRVRWNCRMLFSNAFSYHISNQLYPNLVLYNSFHILFDLLPLFYIEGEITELFRPGFSKT